jgi:prepilin peptidase CpaA
MMTLLPQPGLLAILLLLVLVAAVYDVRYRRIPNWLTVGGVLAGSIANMLYAGWPGLGLSMAGLALSFTVYILLYILRAMGAGDVKLHAAVGATVGWQNWLGIFVITSIIGALMSLIVIIQKRRFRKTMWNVAFILSQMKRGRPAYQENEELDVKSPKALGLPHGAVVAVGTMFFLAYSEHMLK